MATFKKPWGTHFKVWGKGLSIEGRNWESVKKGSWVSIEKIHLPLSVAERDSDPLKRPTQKQRSPLGMSESSVPTKPVPYCPESFLRTNVDLSLPSHRLPGNSHRPKSLTFHSDFPEMLAWCQLLTSQHYWSCIESLRIVGQTVSIISISHTLPILRNNEPGMGCLRIQSYIYCLEVMRIEKGKNQVED